MPADITITPWSLKLRRLAAQSFGDHLAAHHFGHRAAAGVARADQQHHQARQPLERLLGNDAGRRISKFLPSTCTTVDGWPRRLWPSLSTNCTSSPSVVEHFLGGDRLGPAAGIGAGQARPARPASAGCRAPSDGPARAGRSCRWGRPPAARTAGSRRIRLSGWQSPATSVTGPGPAAAGQAPAQRAQVGNVVQHVVGAADRQRQGLAGRSALVSMTPGDGRFAQGAGGQTVNRFGGQGHQLAFGQGLNRSMDHVARIFGAADIDHKGGHTARAPSAAQLAATSMKLRRR